jgi:hypothetical protein
MAEASSSHQDRTELRSFFNLAQHNVTTDRLEATIKAIIGTDGYADSQELQNLTEKLSERIKEQRTLEKNPFAKALASQANQSPHFTPLEKDAHPVPTFKQPPTDPETYTFTGAEDRLQDTSILLLPANPTPEQVSSLRSFLQNPQSGSNRSWALNQVKQTSLQAGKKVAIKGFKKLTGKAAVKLATRAGLKTAAKVAAGAATGGAGAVAIEVADRGKKYIKLALKALAGALALFFIRTILPLLKSLGAITSALGGISAAFAAGIPAIPAIPVGIGGGFVFHKTIVEPAGGYSGLAQSAATKAAQVGHALTTAAVTPGLALFSVLGAFGSIVAITWFGMSHYLAAFTVPNPQGATPYLPVPITPAPPISVSLQDIFQQASDITCIP